MLKYNIKEVNSEIVTKLIKSHATDRYTKLERYYKGEHEILNRAMKDPSKPNNKVVANFAQYISDFITGYFIGNPIIFRSQNEKLLTMIQDIANYNDQASVDADLALISSIKSKSYELLYLDEDNMIRSAALQPENVIYVYDTSVNPIPVLAIYYYWENFIDSEKQVIHAYVYTPTEKIEYISNDVYSDQGIQGLQEVKRIPHYWGQVPIIEYNNPAGEGDFEDVISLIDAHNKVLSDSVNNFDYFADAYMVIKGAPATKDADLKDMKEARTIVLTENSDTYFMVKPSIEEDMKLLKDQLISEIHMLSRTPNLRDDAFSGSASGVALKYKLYGLEQYTALKERNFRKSVQRRLELICHMLDVKGLGKHDYRDIDIIFVRNLPQNEKELAEIVNLLKDIVPKEILLPVLPFIDSYEDISHLDEEKKPSETTPEASVDPVEEFNEEELIEV